MIEVERQIPETWVLVKLGSFVESEKGKKPKKQSGQKSGGLNLPYIDIEAFEKGIIKSWTNGEGCRLCYDTDFLMVWDGSRSGLVGKGMNGALGSTLVRINFPGIYNSYAYYFLQSKFLEINSRAKGSGTPHVDPDLLWSYDFPIAPLSEQKRIVDKIEELFFELDKGAESLKAAREQIKIYRQAVLKDAFEGGLTCNWRKKNRENLEPAAVLLERIKSERELSLQQQLIGWKNKALKKPQKHKAHTPISADQLEMLADLPESWKWCKIGELFNVYVGSTPSRKKQEFWNGSIPWVSSGEVAFCKIFDTKEKITQAGYEGASTQIHPSGTVMLAMIGEGKTRGQAAILKIEAAHNQNTAAIRVSETECSSLLFYYYLLYQYELTRRLGSGNNQKALNKDRVSSILFPLAPLSEQRQLEIEIERQLSVIENLETIIDSGLAKLEALRQAVLKKAFSGKIVAQNTEDEPASVLLERIHAEKKSSTPRVKGKRNAA